MNPQRSPNCSFEQCRRFFGFKASPLTLKRGGIDFTRASTSTFGLPFPPLLLNPPAQRHRVSNLAIAARRIRLIGGRNHRAVQLSRADVQRKGASRLGIGLRCIIVE